MEDCSCPPEPHHRKALGYWGRSAPKDHPEYLVAPRDDRSMLNLIDADHPAYIPKEIRGRSLTFIQRSLRQKRRVLVHCNQGRSRAPAIGLLYLACHTELFRGPSYITSHERFVELYPAYDPAQGVRGFQPATGRLTAGETWPIAETVSAVIARRPIASELIGLVGARR